MEQLVNMNPVFAKANVGVKEMSMDPQSRLAYEKRLDQVLFRRIELRKMREKGEKIGVKKGEKIGVKKGEKIGLKRGEEIGVKKGEKIGVKKGEKIGLKKRDLDIAIQMRDEGLEPEFIRRFTGLSLEDIKRLESENSASS